VGCAEFGAAGPCDGRGASSADRSAADPVAWQRKLLASSTQRSIGAPVTSRSDAVQVRLCRCSVTKPNLSTTSPLATCMPAISSPGNGVGHAGTQNGVEQLFIDQEVLQAASGNQFPATIRLFVGGHAHLFEHVQRLVRAKSAVLDAYDMLTPREREVLEFVSDGYTNARVASHLSINRRTAEAHRASVMHKLQLH